MMNQNTQKIRLELSHDILAKKVYQISSTEDKRILKIERMIHDSYNRFVERKLLMGREDVIYIQPFLSKVSITAAEQDFISKSIAKKEADERKKRLQVIAAMIGLILLSLTAFAFIYKASVDVQEAEAKTERANMEAKATIAKADSVTVEAQKIQSEAIERERSSIEARNEALKIAEIAKSQAAIATAQAETRIRDINKEIDKLEREKISIQVNATKRIRYQEEISEAIIKEAQEEADSLIEVAKEQIAIIEKQKEVLENLNLTSLYAAQALRLLQINKNDKAADKALLSRTAWENILTRKDTVFYSADAHTAMLLVYETLKGLQNKSSKIEFDHVVRSVSTNFKDNSLVIGNEGGHLCFYPNANEAIEAFPNKIPTVKIIESRGRTVQITNVQNLDQYILLGTTEGHFVIFSKKTILQKTNASISKTWVIRTERLKKEGLFYHNFQKPINQITVAANQEKFALHTHENDSVFIFQFKGEQVNIKERLYLKNTNTVAWEDNQTLLIGSDSGLKTYTIGKNISDHLTFSLKTPVAAISMNANHLAIGDKNGKVWIINRKNQTYLKDQNGQNFFKEHNAPLSDLKFSLDGTTLISSSFDGLAKVWNLAYLNNTLDARLTLRGHTDWIFGSAVSPSGKYLFTVSEDQTLRQWHLREVDLKKALQKLYEN